MSPNFNIVIAGGGFAGLFCARELIRKGLPVKVLEEHNEIGRPNKCSGVVSSRSLKELGLFPLKRGLQNQFSKIMFHSPNDNKMTLRFKSSDILVLDRYKIDNFLAEDAVKLGAEITLSSRVEEFTEEESSVKVRTKTNDVFSSKYFIDARGVASYKNRRGLYNGIQSHALYKDFESDHIHVFLDRRLAPGFFAWLIPIDEYTAKIGLASRGQVIERFKLFKNRIGVKNVLDINISPIIVDGPIDRFVRSKIVYVGDSAGQTKPTTGGGIYFGGFASMLASEAFKAKNGDHDTFIEEQYEKKWFSRFKREIEYMKVARSYYEKMTNNNIEKLFTIAKETYSSQVDLEVDYDFHMSSLVKILGLKTFLSIAMTVFGKSIKASLENFIGH
ncbi:MAG: NAD(P)/FAD-dependent oxidoreductase [Nitrososphaeria archaeon]